MKNVYLIGNGFDLNLGLKTSYRDFVNSDFFIKHVGTGLELFEHLHHVHQGSNWIDIEKELEIFSIKSNSYNYFLSEYKVLCQSLRDYINFIDTSLIDFDSDAYKLFSENELSDFIVINFNYTDSVFNVLKSLGYDESVRERIIHVHGSVAQKEIIFGVDDKADINRSHTFLYKSTSSIFNGRDCISALNDFDNLHVFGHSLGESDHMYFGFLHSLSVSGAPYGQMKSIKLYHYGEEAKYDIYRQLHKLTYSGVSQLKNKTIYKDIELQ
ncbi:MULTISPECIES: AbiH family protein [Vibrio]|uniref:AbiH family protein n=1 Tax=Vibrio TaxID=662 RepID=UPI001CDB8A75|nr:MULTISPECIES: AbiH family protein [Vibrio]MCA2483289.1 bacteriophage abortive infection AbiH family protein [Vibrio alginolyticus]MDW2279597.1 AbiH family protein [Vibrio sp. 1402]